MSELFAYSILGRPDDGAMFVPMEMLTREESFCTQENLLLSIAYINQEFQLLRFPCLQYGEQKSDIVFFINRLHDLLKLYHKSQSVRDELENKVHRLTSETDHYKSAQLRMSRQQEQTDRELGQEREKLRQLNEKYKQVFIKLKAEQEDVKRLKAVLQSKEVHYKHELKKKEREVNKLKERLNQLLSDKAPERKIGMDLMNVVSHTEGRRSTWKSVSGKHDEEVFRHMISNLEEKQNELLLENGEWRDCVLVIQREVTALLHKAVRNIPKTGRHESPTSTDEDQPTIPDLGEGYQQMPCEFVRLDIERTVGDACKKISRIIKKLAGQKIKSPVQVSTSRPFVGHKQDMSSRRHTQDMSSRRNSQDHLELEKLRKRMSNYKLIIQQQEDLIQQSLRSQSQSLESSSLQQTQLQLEKEDLSEQRKQLLEEKRVLEREKQLLREVGLGPEKKVVQEQKTSSHNKQELLSTSPLKEFHVRTGGGASPRLLPATPVPTTPVVTTSVVTTSAVTTPVVTTSVL
ncbi:afadin- and alpha-actinin-binding protein-like, partial [Physella acuta]|uniref:afadin- and alpha-actinin-binding protein-like n=1 Tax=Physella acuta TaxID=109671 RepID=UPI0027DC436E